MRKRKLSNEDVINIRILWSNGVRIETISKKYNCAAETLKNAIHGRKRFKEIL